MPVQDWSRVPARMFHHFHNSWIYKLSDRLNAGLLPEGFFAAGEQITGDIEPDVLTLEQTESATDASRGGWQHADGVMAVAETPPRVAFVADADEERYVHRQDSLVIRYAPNERIVALMEIVSRGNKNSRHRMERLLHKIASCLENDHHLLIVDLHPPGSFDPKGIHAAVWEYLYGESVEFERDEPLTLVSYRATPSVRAYVQPISVGQSLPDMPLFLSSDHYVNVPLEETCGQAWRGLPAPWKRHIEEINN